MLGKGEMPLSFAIIGCGLIGHKRLSSLKPGQLAVACDIDGSRAEALAKIAGESVRSTTNVADALADPAINAVVVATANASLAKITAVALRAGKAVLVEKPAAISVAEVDELISLSHEWEALVRVGYNHRFHPAIRKARELVDSGAVGPMMFLRARYGHGGRVGYEREWRAEPGISGGGELIDQGVHLIDLARWFLGEFTRIEGHATTSYWDMPADDNAFLSLRTADNKTAWLHVSCTEWKNTFSFEIYGRNGKLHIEGLGGSYGVESLSYYKMSAAMGPPETMIWEFPGVDESWRLEMQEFADDIRLGRTPTPGLLEARRTLEIVHQIYRSSGYSFAEA